MFYCISAFAEMMPSVRLLLLSVVLSQIISGRADPLQGEMTIEFSPKLPLFATGSTMEVNGTLRNASPGITAHQVYCMFDNANQTVVVLDNDTFQVRQENVTRQMSHGHIYCYLNAFEVSKSSAHFSIRVADFPVAPNITGCVVYNWERMVCSWETPKRVTGLNTTYMLSWTNIRKERQWNDCPYSGNTTCEWNSTPDGHFRTNMFYYMRVRASNDLKSVESQTFVVETTNNIVKPNSIWDLHLNHITSQSVDLSWTWHMRDSYHTNKDLIYRVNYTSKWHKQSVETPNKTVVLSSLVPNTKYTISVECSPQINGVRTGFWSDKFVQDFLTLDDVPGRAPALADGSYKSSTKLHERSVEVFWQPVPDRWLHGRLTRFRIRYSNYWNRSHNVVERFEDDLQRLHLELSLPNGQDFVVTVEAETTKGYNKSLDLKNLVIPRADWAPAMPDNVYAVRNESEIVVMWSNVSNASGYTVYWCKKGGYGHCVTSYNWTSVSSDVTNLTIFVGIVKHDDFTIAVSVEMYVADLKQIVSSGMILTACVPDIAKNAKAPDLVDFATEQKPLSLSVVWKKPKCEETAYIVKFEIFYCQRQSCIDDVCCFNNKTMCVESSKEQAVINGLTADVEYEVSVRSISIGSNSNYTSPIRHTVLRSGLSAGVIAGIVIAALVLLLFLVVGLLTIAKKIKKFFYCCEKIKIVSPPPVCRIQCSPEQADNQVQFYRGPNIQLKTEEAKSLLHDDGTATNQETDPEMGAVFVRGNDVDHYRHPSSSKSFQPLVIDNGALLTARDEVAPSGVAQPNDSSISTYTHLAVPDESTHKESNSFAEIGHASSDDASHILPRIAADSSPSHTVDVIEPRVSGNVVTNVADPYMPVEKIPSLPVVGSSSSSTITPYTTVEQTSEMTEPKTSPTESRGCLPPITKGDELRQVELPAVDSSSANPDDYQRVQHPIDNYISGTFAGISNVPGEMPVSGTNNAELMAGPVYANHQTPRSEDGYSDQRDFTVGTSSSSGKPLLPVGYIPLAPTLST